MRLAIVTEVRTSEAGALATHEVVPIVGADLRQRLHAALGNGWLLTRADAHRIIDGVFDAEEESIRQATLGLGPEHE